MKKKNIVELVFTHTIALTVHTTISKMREESTCHETVHGLS